jgi:GNAT superfamily N-acetyltransferase
MTVVSLHIRQASEEDRPGVVALCRAALGWDSGGVDEAFFAWKHDENAFGASPCWIAEEDGRILGVRVFMRWRFVAGDGRTFDAVRAVDTATHPDAQGRGIFTKLTLGALPDLRDMAVGFVFNTPNDKSRPGYLKMGWGTVGRVPVAVRPTSARSLPNMAGARVGAERWSEETDVGLDAGVALAEHDEVDRALRGAVRVPGLRTDHTARSVEWRYAFEPLRYRVWPLGDRLGDGFVVYRVRRRGSARELTICEVLAPRRAPLRRALAEIARRAEVDFSIASSGIGLSMGFVPVPQLGPILTWKPINRVGVPRMRDLALTMGDVELF